MTVCAACGTTLLPSSGSRPRKWCSERCRKSQYAGTCARCGDPRHDGSRGHHGKFCRRCSVEEMQEASRLARHRRRDLVYAEIERLWNDGFVIADIAVALGRSQGYVAGSVFKMRQEGWSVPYRYACRGSKAAA